MRKMLSIKNKLLVYFGGILIIGLLVNGLVASWLCRGLMEDKVEQSIRALVTSCSQKINIILENKQANLEVLTKVPFLIHNKQISEYTIEEKIEFLRKANNFYQFSSIGIADLDGNSYTTDNNTYNIAHEEAFEKALQGQVAYTNAIESEGKSFFAILVPIKDDKEEVVGVLFGCETTLSFQRALDKAGINEDFFILDKNSMLIGHYSRYNTGAYLTYEEIKDNPEYVDLKEIYENMIAGKLDTRIYTEPSTGDKNYVSYAPMINGWSIGLLGHSDIILGPMKTFSSIIICSTVFIILVGIIVVYLISSSLSIKINEIILCMDGVAKGDFKQSIPNNLLEMKDEMGDLARSVDMVKIEIEDMLNTIKDCTDFVNEQIEDFTVDIREALKDLVVNRELSDEQRVELYEHINKMSEYILFINDAKNNRLR